MSFITGFSKSLFLITLLALGSSVLGTPLCDIKTYDTSRTYSCGTQERDFIFNHQLPSSFNGATKAVFGLWFQNTFKTTCVSHASDWGLIFKVSYDNSQNMARLPAIYQRIELGVPQLYFGAYYSISSGNFSHINAPLVTNAWYYIVAVTDFKNNAFYMYLYDPSAVTSTISQGITLNTSVTYNGPVVRTAYQSSDFVVLGSDPPNHKLASITLSYPTIIVGKTISTASEVALLAYSVHTYPVFTTDFFGIEIMRSMYDYDSTSNILDITSSVPYSYDFGNADGTAKTQLLNLWNVDTFYETVQFSGYAQTLLLSPNRDYSFIDSFGFLSFGMRIVFKMTSMNFNSTCNYHWIVRRIEALTGNLKFGFGVMADGKIGVFVGVVLANGNTVGFIPANTWVTLKLGCFNRGFTNKILCIFLTSDGITQAREEIWLSYATSPYTSDSHSDLLLFGGSKCGASSIYTLMINKGYIPERIDTCRWGCSITLPTTSYCYHMAYFSNTCPAGNQIKYRTECIKCPIGCATCAMTDFNHMKINCLTCASGLTLNSAGICACPYGKYYDTISGACLARTVLNAYLYRIPNTTYQFRLSFSSAVSDANLLVTFLKPVIQIGDYSGSAATMTALSNRVFQITLDATNPPDVGTVLAIYGIYDYNEFVYNPYMIVPESLSYVFGLDTLSKASTLNPTSPPAETPTVYGPRNPTYLTSSLNIVYGVMGSPGLVLIKILSDITLFKFINVGYPENYLNFKVSTVGHGFFIPNVFGLVEGNSSNIPTSTVGQFQPWEISTIFLQNAGGMLIKEIIIAIILFLCWVTYLASLELPDFKAHVVRIIKKFQWNIALRYFYSDFPELLLYALIHIQQGGTDTLYKRMSIGGIAVIGAMYLAFWIYTYYLLNIKTSYKRINDPEGSQPSALAPRDPSASQVPQNIRIICEDIYQDTFASRNFVLLMLLQSVAVDLILVFVQVSGIAQAFFYVLFTSLFLVYIVIIRPLSSKLLFAIVFVNEVGQLAMGCFAVVLGMNDLYSNVSEDTLNVIGIFMMIIEVVLLFGGMFLVAGLIAIATYQFIRREFILYQEKKKEENADGSKKKKRSRPFGLKPL